MAQTKEQFRQKVEKLKREMLKLVDERLEKVLASECLDLDSAKNTFTLPEAFMSAMGKEIVFHYRPSSTRFLKISKNIERFI